MYLRSKLQTRALENLKIITQAKYPNMRVTKGYVVSELLSNYQSLIKDTDMLKKAILESDVKEEGGNTAVNFNITVEANEKLWDLKKLLDKETGRSFFPAQILDILFICAKNGNGDNQVMITPVSDEELAKVLLDYAYRLLTEDTLSVNCLNAKDDILKALTANHLL